MAYTSWMLMNGFHSSENTPNYSAFFLSGFAAAVEKFKSTDGPELKLNIQIELGRRLFNDRSLSKDGSLSCSSCHDVHHGGALSGYRYSKSGVNGELVKINVPSVLNSGGNFLQFWDGRASSLEAQIDSPLLNPSEMGEIGV